MRISNFAGKKCYFYGLKVHLLATPNSEPRPEGTRFFLTPGCVGDSFWPAMVVGAVLAFNSFTLSNMGQAQLLQLQWLPLALLYMGKLLRKPSIRHALFVALFLVAQFYTVIYYGIFSFVVVGLVGGIGWLSGAYLAMQERLRTGYLTAFGLAVAVALCLPLALAYYSISATYGFERLLSLLRTGLYSLHTSLILSPLQIS